MAPGEIAPTPPTPRATRSNTTGQHQSPVPTIAASPIAYGDGASKSKSDGAKKAKAKGGKKKKSRKAPEGMSDEAAAANDAKAAKYIKKMKEVVSKKK